jgi:hypothetical protein
MAPENGVFLSGEREILNGMLQLCLAWPKSLSLRLLYAETLFSMRRVNLAAVMNYAQRTAMLHQNHPLEGAAQGVAERIFNEAFAR